MLKLKKLKSLAFYTLIIFLPTQLGYHFWPDNVFISGLKIDYLAIVVYLSDLILIFYLLLFIFIDGLKVKSSQLKPFLILFTFQIFQISLFVSFKIQSIYFLIKLILLALFVLSLKKQKYNSRLIAKIFIFQSILLFSLAIAQLVKQSSLQGVFYLLGERKLNLYTPGVAKQNIFKKTYLRPYAIFSHPNVFGAYSLLTFVYFWQNLKEESKKKSLISIFFIINIIISFSQNAWLALFAFVILTMFKNRVVPKSILRLLSFLSFLSPLLLLIAPRFNEIWVRNQIFLLIQNLTPKDWLFGIGFFDSFKYILQGNKQSTFLQPIHNLSWQLLTSQGVLGFILLIKTFRKTSNKIVYKNNAFVLMILLLSSFDHYFLTSQQLVFLLAFLLGDCLNRAHD